MAGFGHALPQARPVYVGPLSSDTVWLEQDWLPGQPLLIEGPYRQIDRPIRADNQRNTVPIVPGAVSLDAVRAAQPDRPFPWALCGLCREGYTFWPTYSLTAGNDKHAPIDSSFLSKTQHLSRADGEEIPETPQGGPAGAPHGGFTLPEQPGTYRLVDDVALSMPLVDVELAG